MQNECIYSVPLIWYTIEDDYSTASRDNYDIHAIGLNNMNLP